MKILMGVLCLISGFTAIGQTNADEEYHLDKEYPINAAGVINLNSSDAKVTITGSNRKNAHVKIDRVVTTKGLTFGHEEFTVEVTAQNGDIQIKEHSNSVSVGVVGYHYEKYTILIEAPEGISLVIRGDDGDYRIKNVDGSISLNLDDADVDLSECSGNKFVFRIDDGDINMDEAKGSLEIDGDDSDIKIRNANLTFIDASLDDGDLVIETSLVDNGQYRIDAQDGLVSFTVLKGGGNFSIRHDDGHINADDNFNTVEDSENNTRLTLPSGTAKVDIRADDARVRLSRR